jgi:hypothetical protein
VTAKLSNVVADLVFTSVQDALVNATYAAPRTIRKAIAYERRHGRRSALIAGLERELRRRKKAAVSTSE